jgi:hypothetical protein
MTHANGAVALEGAVLAAAEPADTAARLSRLAGLPVRTDPLGGFRLVLPGAAGAAGPRSPAMPTALRVLPPAAVPRLFPGVAPPALPSVVGMAVRTGDRAASARRVLAGLPVVETPEGPTVPPELAGGAALVFTG